MITFNKADVTIICGGANEGKTQALSTESYILARAGSKILVVIFEESKKEYLSRYGEVEGVQVLDNLSKYPITLADEITKKVDSELYDYVCIDGLDIIPFDTESAYKNDQIRNEFLMNLSINCDVPIITTKQTMRKDG